MAKMTPPAAAMPMASAQADAGAAPADDSTDNADMGEDGSSSPSVLLTVLKNDDGTFQLIEGDEGDGADGGDEPAGGAGSGPSDQEGQSFDAPGPLLKAILDIIENAQGASGEGTADDNFDAGFKGGSAASPAKPAAGPATKY